MEPADKLAILGESAKYDVSCASSGHERGGKKGSIGNTTKGGICHTFTADGRCISLLKVLLSNSCIYDCAYCINRKSNNIRRATLTADEVADITINFYKRNYIEGLFLSSGVVKNPDYTMEQMVRVIRKLREVYFFNGYIHLKGIPGSSDRLLQEAGLLADRISINMELPSKEGLKLLAPQKNQKDIFEPMKIIKKSILATKEEKKKNWKTKLFTPAGQSTQLIVGATQDTDLSIVKNSENLYKYMNLKRVYYSSYVHVNDDSNLPVTKNSPLLREHRLYQADWLLRFYKFKADEILDDDNPHLDPNFDPKAAWALRHLDRFPVEVNKADYDTLLRVPGMGVRSVMKIINARKVSILDGADLKKIGVVLKRAQYFLTAKGKYLAEGKVREREIRSRLLDAPKKAYEQLKLFSPEQIMLKEDSVKSIYGEF